MVKRRDLVAALHKKSPARPQGNALSRSDFILCSRD